MGVNKFKRRVPAKRLLTLALAVASGFGLGLASALLIILFELAALPALTLLPAIALGVALSAASIWMARRWMPRNPLVWGCGLIGFFGFWALLIVLLVQYNPGE